MDIKSSNTGLMDQLQNRWPLLVATFLLLGAVALVPHITRIFHLWKIPLAGQGEKSTEARRNLYLSNARKVYNEGYKAFQQGVFRIITSRKSPVIVVSPQFLDELKSLPDTVLSMAAAVDETMETKYTRIDTVVPVIPHTIKTALTPALRRLTPIIHKEAQEALTLEMPSSPSWKEIDIHSALLRIVAMVSGRVFIGPSLCRDESYLDASINYTMDVMSAQRAVQRMRPWLRPFLADRLPEVRRLDQRIKEAEGFLGPVVRERKGRKGEKQKEDDMLQWLMDNQGKFPEDEASQNLARAQLGLGFAAIHTTALTATNAFYDLVAIPGLAEELREEVLGAVEEFGEDEEDEEEEEQGEEGGKDDRKRRFLTAAALQNMKKMDSFLKEVLRVSPASMASFQRKVLSPITLSNGTIIPSGVTIEVPAVSVNSDDSVFPDADRFDPMRFYKLREEKSSSSKEKNPSSSSGLNQFVSVSSQSLTFGFGRHACPGRFFAANEIKTILACALLGWEFGMPGMSTSSSNSTDTKEREEDEKKADNSNSNNNNPERYPNIEFAHMCIPDFSKKLLCRRREE